MATVYVIKAGLDSGVVNYKNQDFYIKKGWLCAPTKELRDEIFTFIQCSGMYMIDPNTDSMDEIALLDPLSAATAQNVDLQSQLSEKDKLIAALQARLAAPTK